MNSLKRITAVFLVLSFVLLLCACKDREYYSKDATIGTAKENDMDAILSGTFYFDAVMNSYGEEGKTSFAIDGSNIYMRAETNGVDMGMIYMGDTMYMLYENRYAELKKTVLKIMGIDVDGDIPKQLGFNKEDILAIFTGLGEGTETKDELNGVKVTRISYPRKDGATTVAYLDKNGDLLRAESYSVKNTLVETIDFNEVSGVIPTDIFILDSYDKTDIMTLMLDVMKVMETE